MSEENNTAGKILVLQEELVEIEKIREGIATKLEELRVSENKMETLSEAFITHIHALEKHQEAQPELI